MMSMQNFVFWAMPNHLMIPRRWKDVALQLRFIFLIIDLSIILVLSFYGITVILNRCLCGSKFLLMLRMANTELKNRSCEKHRYSLLFCIWYLRPFFFLHCKYFLHFVSLSHIHMADPVEHIIFVRVMWHAVCCHLKYTNFPKQE